MLLRCESLEPPMSQLGVISAQSIHYRRSRRVRFAPKANKWQIIRRVHQDKDGLAAQ